MTSKPRLLIIKLGALGDLFFALPSLSYIRSAFPQAEIEWLVSENLASALLPFNPPNSPSLTIHTLDGATFFKGTARQKLRLLHRTRQKLKGPYDGIFLLHRHWSYLLMTIGLGPVFRLARSDGRRARWLPLNGGKNIVVPPLQMQESRAIREVIDGGLRALGKTPQAGWSIPSAELAEPLVPTGSIVVHLGGGQNMKTEFTLKRWPKMAELIGLLLQSGDQSITLVGDRIEEAEAMALVQHFKNSRVRNLVGQTSLPQLISTLAHAQLVIGPDSGPLHIADQLGVPAIGLYGPTSPISWGLIGSKSRTLHGSFSCQPCYLDDGNFPPCPYDHRCMKAINAHDVASAAHQILSECP